MCCERNTDSKEMSLTWYFCLEARLQQEQPEAYFRLQFGCYITLTCQKNSSSNNTTQVPMKKYAKEAYQFRRTRRSYFSAGFIHKTTALIIRSGATTRERRKSINSPPPRLTSSWCRPNFLFPGSINPSGISSTPLH